MISAYVKLKPAKYKYGREKSHYSSRLNYILILQR